MSCEACNHRRVARKRRAFPCVALLFLSAAALWAQTQPATSTAPSTAPKIARVPTTAQIEALLSKNKSPVDFSNIPISEAVAAISRNYDVAIVNPYEPKNPPLTPEQEMFKARVTLVIRQPVGALEAIRLLDDMILPMGFMLQAEITHDDPPILLFKIIRTTDQHKIPVFTGGAPEEIPDNDEVRTQVIFLAGADPAKVKEMIAPILGKKAEVVLSAINRTVIITDSGARIRTAASLIQVLEKQAQENKTHP